MLFQWDGINSSFIGVNSVNMRGEKLVPGHNFEVFFYKTRKNDRGIAGAVHGVKGDTIQRKNGRE